MTSPSGGPGPAGGPAGAHDLREDGRYDDNRYDDNRYDGSRDLGLLLRLLEESQWRERLVERVTLTSPSTARTESGLQVRLAGVLPEQAPLWQPVPVVLPLLARPKAPIVGLRLAGGETAPTAALRVDAAAVQAQLLVRLAHSSPGGSAVAAGLPGGLMQAIAGFSPRRFLVLRERRRSRLGPRPALAEALAQLLREGSGLVLPSARVAELAELAESAGRPIAAATPGAPDPASAAEQVLLAVPTLVPSPRDLEEVTQVVVAYEAAVRAADHAGDLLLLRTLGEAGRLFPLLVATEAVPARPTVVRAVEQRRVRLGLGGWYDDVLPLDAAASYHLELTVEDPSVSVRQVRLRAVDGEAAPTPEHLQADTETVSLYESRPDRPAQVRLLVRVGAARQVLAVIVSVGLLTAGAALAVLVDTRPDAQLSLLTIPTSFAVAVVVTRERTSLAAHVLRVPRLVTLLAFILLWAGVLCQIATVPRRSLIDVLLGG